MYLFDWRYTGDAVRVRDRRFVNLEIDNCNSASPAASRGKLPGNMAKREGKTASIEITCTPSQKTAIKARSQSVGAKSVSEYLLTIALKGNVDDYGFMRRKADGPLVNAATYQRLGEMIELLETRICATSKDSLFSASPDAQSLLQELIEQIHETRREIALNRLKNAVNRL